MKSRVKEDIKYLKKAFNKHKGKWLDEDGVSKYQKLAKELPTTITDMTGEKRKLCLQMMQEYDITEIEATNIINGKNASDYIAKYERIRTQTPLQIKKDKKDIDEVDEIINIKLQDE